MGVYLLSSDYELLELFSQVAIEIDLIPIFELVLGLLDSFRVGQTTGLILVKEERKIQSLQFLNLPNLMGELFVQGISL